MTCPHCLGEHGPALDGIYIDFRGWRFTPPFICVGCGIETCHVQWAFSRSCGPCDISHSPTRRVMYGACFAGPHVSIAVHDPRDPGALLAEDFLDPADREKWPVINPPKNKSNLPKEEI